MRSRFRPRALRSVQMTITLTMLAVPASAFALSDSTSADTQDPASLPVKVTPRSVRLGAPVTVSGRAPRTDSGDTVELQAAAGAGGRWRSIARARIGRLGGYSMRTRPEHSGVLRAVTVASAGRRTAVASVASGNATGFATSTISTKSVSRATPIEVKASMRVDGRVHDVVAGDDARISGRLLPGRAGRQVSVQALAAGRWRTLARGRTGAAGGFAVRFRPQSGTARDLRVAFAGDRDNGRATDGAGSLELFDPVIASWYEDAGSTACGFHAADGIANRTLPCGTKVALRHGGHTVTATVDDRGPYVYGREFDLSQTTAAALGFSGVGTVYASIR